MFNFNGITHVIENPSGHAEGYNYSAVGAVPVSVDHGRYETAAQLATAVRAAGVTKMCDNPRCACARLLAEVA